MSYIPVNEPLLNGNELKYVTECIESGWISSEGPFVEKFENKFSKIVQRNHSISVTNGTAAIDACIEVLNIKKGDEIIMPTFTIISCINQIIRLGAKPVLIDSDPITWNMDVNLIEGKITNKTKAIMVVHIYGLPVDMNPVIEIAKKYNLLIIEDAAEMHGQTYYDKPCGSFGNISTFSFYPNKHITTGEGGMICTNDDELAVKCKKIRNLYFEPERRFVHKNLGWNLRLTNVQAAIGLAQLERLDTIVKIKRDMGFKYRTILNHIDGLTLPLESTNYSKNIYWVFGVVLDRKFGKDAFEIMSILNKEGIGTRPFFYPMHLQPVFHKMGLFKNESYPVAENLAKYGFYLPSGLNLNEDQIERSADTLIQTLKYL
jgi:perosamine synthetase